jgi:hypothetical protein
MPSEWSRFEVLLCELGALRASAPAGAEVDGEVAAIVERQIAAAAEAIHDLSDHPRDQDTALHAWELVLQARDLIERLQRSRSVSRDLVLTSDALRERARAALATSDGLIRNPPRRG